MVPCQPRQLVIFSLPFAALVAFFWFKRRKSLSRSDPGGTSGQRKPVDDPAPLKQPDKKVVPKSVCAEPSKAEHTAVKSANAVADQPLKTDAAIEEIVAIAKKTPLESVIPSQDNIGAKKVLSNVADSHTVSEPVENIVPCDLGTPTPDFDVHKVLFHSTIIEDSAKEVAVFGNPIEKSPLKKVDLSLVDEAYLVKLIDQICSEAERKVTELQETSKLSNSLEIKESENATIPLEVQSTVENHLTNVEEPVKEDFEESSEKPITQHQDIEETIAIEDQSTVENIALKTKIDGSLETSSASVSSSADKTKGGELSDSACSSSESTESIENTSVDTGVGTSTEEVFPMAQGHVTEEMSESGGEAFEQKLASLGLDTQQPSDSHRAERDSANHSPAEVMLNSPSISTFSDAHSEVMLWLHECEKDPEKPSEGQSLNAQGCLPYTVHPSVHSTFHSSFNEISVPSPDMNGSSDSGKGCSDVATPPPRTPAGGSSVAGDQVPSLYEFVLPQVIVGRLIGRHGAFLHDIRTKTHTNVFIKRHPETNTLKICAIEGTQPDIDAALKMIRQKFPIRRFPDLTLERVSFVKNSTFPISPENLQLQLVEGVNNDVLVSSVISAGNLFLQMPMHLSYQSLYRMACIMNTVYTTEESPPLKDPRPDVVCVAPSHGGWYRAQIISVDDETNSSIIRFLDYGGYTTVENSALRQIRGDFMLLPFQAVECALAKVVPAGGEPDWSEEARQFVQMMTTQQVLHAQVCEYTNSGLPLVYLYCTQFYQSPTDPSGFETRVVLLNDELVANGFADPTEEEEAEGEGEVAGEAGSLPSAANS